MLTCTIIAEMIEIGKLVEAFKKCDSNDILNKIKIHLTQDAYRFKNVGKNSMVEDLAFVMNNDDDECRLNVIQKETSYETTAYLRGEIKFSRVLKKHISLVMRELDHRNISFSDNMIVRDLKQKLRNNEKV